MIESQPTLPLNDPFYTTMNKMNKETPRKRVLLIWWETKSRPELLEPFRQLSDRFEFIHLFFKDEKEREAVTSPFPMIYWFDYSTPYKLLDKVKPDVIFSEFPTDLKTIGLNIAAHNRGIPFLGMTHGIYFDNSFDITIANYNSIKEVNKYVDHIRIMFFYFASFKFKNLKYIFPAIRLLFHYIKDGYWEALRKVKFKIRLPDKYIVYQMKNSDKAIWDMHGCPPEKLVAIGVPQFDIIFKHWNSCKSNGQITEGGYYLMVDTAWIFNNDMPPPDVINDTYLRIAAYCKSRNAKLIVKLHPFWYTKNDLPVSENIEYVRNIPQEELSRLIIQSKGCFLYFSTLSIPIVPYKNCYFLYYGKPSKDLVEIVELKVAKSIDIRELDNSRIDFDNGFDRSRIDEYIKDYLYAIDGKATGRLEKILEEA